jgi:ribosomal protein S12 methylthiotransferase accessory factor
MMFWKRPRFKHHFRVDIVAGENAVYLLSSQQKIVLRGKVYVALAPLLTGRQSLDDIVSALQSEVPASAVWYTLTELAKLGYITDESDGLVPEQAAFWSAMGIEPQTGCSQARGPDTGRTVSGSLHRST